MRRGGTARFAVWIALGGIGATSLANCTDFGGDFGIPPGAPDAALLDASTGLPGVLWDVTAPADQRSDGTNSGGGVSNEGGDEGGSSGTNYPVESGSVSSPSGGTTTGDADLGMDSNVNESDGENGGEVEAGDAGADAGAPEAAGPESSAPDVAAPDAAADGGGSDAGAGDTGAVTVDASVQDGGADSGIADSANPETSADSGTDSGAAHGCNPTDPHATTQTCFAAQNRPSPPGQMLPSCVDCATSNGCFDPTMGGGTCEMLSTTLTHLSGSLPDGKTCSAVLGTEPVTEKLVCVQTLQLIFSSKCGATLQLTPCFCGTADPTLCTAGTATPNGPAYDEYACDMNTASGQTINTDFIVQTFGAGMANSIAECAGSFGCACF